MILGTWFAGWAGWQWGPWAAIVFGALRRRARRPAARPRHGHLRRRPHRLRHRHQPHRARASRASCRASCSSATATASITQSPTMTELASGRFTMPFIPAASSSGARPRPAGLAQTSAVVLHRDVAGLLNGFTTSLAYTTMIALLLIPISGYVLWRTAFGLRLRSSGEKPCAADSLGVAVYRIQYLAVTISGFLAGLGGAWLAIDVRAYNQDQTAGRGFQGLAALIFGNWRPARHRRRRRPVRLRPGADAADRHGAGAGAVPRGRDRVRRARRLLLTSSASCRRRRACASPASVCVRLLLRDHPHGRATSSSSSRPTSSR